jgi:hypothetical protein
MKKKQIVRHIALWATVAALGAGIWLWFGWINRGTNLKTLDYGAFSANYKQDGSCPWGRKAAVYQNQVYYSDPAGGGIFRMNLDGSQEQRVLECADIRKLQLTPEGIHYLGFIGNARKAGAERRPFRLFLYDWATGEVLQANLQKWDSDLWDFYVAEDGAIANMNLREVVSEGYVNTVLYCTAGESYVPCGRLAVLRDFSVNRQERVPGSAYPGLGEMGGYGELVLSANSLGVIRNVIEYELAWGGFAVTDRQKNRVVIDTEPLQPCLGGPPSYHRTIDGFLPEGALVHVGNEVMLLSADLQDSVRSVLLGGEEAIRLVAVDGGNAYLIAEKASGEKRQTVYELDLRSFACRKLYACAQSERFLLFETKGEERVLWLDPEKLVTARGRVIRVWALEDGEYKLDRTAEVKQDVVDPVNETEVAGDWLFVYRFDREENRDELVEKVGIGLEEHETP